MIFICASGSEALSLYAFSIANRLREESVSAASSGKVWWAVVIVKLEREVVLESGFR
jgi:hypothetical protein